MYTIDTMPVHYTYCPEFDPKGFPGIRALTYDGMSIGDKKTKVFAYIGFPKDTPAPVPAVVLVHGGGGHAFPEWVARWNAQGFAAIAMDTTGYYPDPESEKGVHYGLYGTFADDAYTTAPDNDGSMPQGVDSDIEKNWLYHAIADAIIARKILASHAAIDASKIGICGISWGGVITSLTIGHDPNFAFAVPIYGSGYLGSKHTLGSIARHFEPESVRSRFLAEDRFQNVKTPTLWLCWNDDNNFSIQANTASYLDTCQGNRETRLSIVHNMHHSHPAGWVRPESITFAKSIVSGAPALPKLLNQPEGRHCTVDVDYSGNFTAVAYYITSPMTYSVHSKFGGNAYTYMDQTWNIIQCTMNPKTHQVTCDLPTNAAGYYLEIKTLIDGEEFVVTSGYVTVA